MDRDKVLESFANSPLLFDVVHTFLKESFGTDVTLTSGMTNELLGEKTRARLEGIATVDDAFRRMKNYKSVKNNTPEKNPAR